MVISAWQLVHGFLEDSARSFPEKNALFAVGKWHTYRQLNEQANRLARVLLKKGLAKGDRVGLLIENSAEYVVSYYGILKAGGTTVALNTESTPDDVSFVIGDCGIRFLIVGQKLLTRLLSVPEGRPESPALARQDTLEAVFAWAPPGSPLPAVPGVFLAGLPDACSLESSEGPAVRMIDLDIASIVYTSGSTGKPRGAVLSHLNIVANTRSIVEYLRLSPDDRIMVVLPFYYIYGKSLLNTHFAVGGSVVIDNRFLYPNVILQTMQDQETTGFAGVPSTFTILLNRSNVRSRRFPKLRYLTQAGGAMAPSIQKDVAETFAPASLFIMYGATEASARLSYLPPEDLPRKWGSIGKAIPNVELFVADEHGRPLPAGKEGEIAARGSNIMSGYWNHPEETSKVLRNGLYYTGDIGRADEEGYLYVVGRTKDMIKIGGNRVSAKEIEEALLEHPAVAEAAVIGVPDLVLGEAPKAILVLKGSQGGEIIEQLPRFLQDHLALYKIPKFFEIRDSLPKTDSGKILKQKLR
jgi:long-chain acyl-CoA synthetase